MFLIEYLNLKKIKNFLIEKGYKEKDKLIPEHLRLGQESEFTEVDKAIWLSFKSEVEKSGGVFIFMNCYQYHSYILLDIPSNKNRKFLIDNKILLLANKITREESDKLKKEEIKTGTYNKLYDSHRAGYKANKKVADNIMDFLLHNDLLPDKL